MEMLESPNYDINPIFSENSETIWDLKICCNLCSNSIFNQKCIRCLITIINKLSPGKKRMNCVTFENKWQLDAIGTNIILDLWKKRKDLATIFSFILDVEKEEEFILNVISSLEKKFHSSELPRDYFKSKKINFDKNTISFLKYSLNQNSNFDNNLEIFFGPFLKKYANSFREKLHSGKLIVSYNILDANLFRVEIYEASDSELFYQLTPLYDTIGYQHYKPIIHTISSNIDEIFDPNRALEDEIQNLTKKATFYLHKTFPGLKKAESEVIALFSALYFLNFTKLFGLLADENIEECFIDSPQDSFYLDHKIYGRCRTNIRLNDAELEAFKSLSKILSKKRLEINFPHLKYSLNLFNSQFRIAIDIGPVNLNDFSLTIRRPRKMGWNLSELVKNNTVSSELAAFLLWCAQNHINITVTGETDSGKTTLINAIDKLLPLNLRRIYIEDVKESLPRDYEAHQIFFQASDSEESKNKSHLIVSLLHRSPDFVYLGEILTQEEAQAMFHSLSVGLKGVQTIHAQSIESLINRWIFHFKINPSLLQNLGLIVLMKKIGNKRVVTEIAEILGQGENIEIVKLVLYEARQNRWIYENKLFNSIRVQESLRFQSCDEDTFFLTLKKLEERIQYL